MVARRAHNPKVVGSNPASATSKAVHRKVSCFFHLQTKIHGKDSFRGFFRSRKVARSDNPKVAQPLPLTLYLSFYLLPDSSRIFRSKQALYSSALQGSCTSLPVQPES